MVQLSFTWRDFERVERRLRLALPKADLNASRREFGCDPQLLQPRQIQAQRTITYTAEQARDPAAMARLKAEANAAMQQEIEAELQRHRAALHRRGFLYLDQHTVTVDLATLWRWNQTRMRPVADQLRAAAGNGDFARAALAFVQELPYQELPDTLAGRYVGGVLPPLETLVAGYGDCDSKALLFASLVDDGAGPEVLLLRGPEHMVAAVACERRAKGFRVTAFGQSWQVCECSHGVWEPGEIDRAVRREIERGRFAPVRLREATR